MLLPVAHGVGGIFRIRVIKIGQFEIKDKSFQCILIPLCLNSLQIYRLTLCSILQDAMNNNLTEFFIFI